MAYRNMEKALEQFDADAVMGHAWGLDWKEFESLADRLSEDLGGFKAITSAYNYGFLRGMRYEKAQARHKAQDGSKAAHVHYMTLARALAATDTAMVESFLPALQELKALCNRQRNGEQITPEALDGILRSLEGFNENLLEIYADNEEVCRACVTGAKA